MHPLYSLYVAELLQAERLREARNARHLAVVRRQRRARLRTEVGYRLVELGLRLAVQPAPRVRVAR